MSQNVSPIFTAVLVELAMCSVNLPRSWGYYLLKLIECSHGWRRHMNLSFVTVPRIRSRTLRRGDCRSRVVFARDAREKLFGDVRTIDRTVRRRAPSSTDGRLKRLKRGAATPRVATPRFATVEGRAGRVCIFTGKDE